VVFYLDPIWEEYLKHRNLDQLREDILTCPWHSSPKMADESLLMQAVISSDLGAAKLLMSLGESPSAPASDGFSLLHKAVDEATEAATDLERGKALAILTALLEGGADPNVQGIDGTPLHRAAGAGDIDAARILLAHGADPEVRMLIDGELPPIVYAELMGKPLMVQFLREAGANRKQ